MRKNAAREKPLTDVESRIIKLSNETAPEVPRLIQTVLQVIIIESNIFVFEQKH